MGCDYPGLSLTIPGNELINRLSAFFQPSTGTADLHAQFYPPPKKAASSAADDSEAGAVEAVLPPVEAAAPIKPKKHILCVNT